MIQDLIRDVTEVLQSHAQASAKFDLVNGAEPKSAPPGNGLSCGIWVQSLRPVRSSGGTATSVILIMSVRVYTNMFAEPSGSIDPDMMEAVGALMDAYSGDFTLDGLTGVRNIDLLGWHSDGLGGQAGYVEMDHKMFRIFTIDVPIILNDVFTQAA
jgi:hypothetical protein